MNTAIIVAAGIGNRFGGRSPKQFAELLGKPVLAHTIERFESNGSIDQIILVLPAGEVERHPEELLGQKFSKLSKIVPGGDTRRQSVLNGLRKIPDNESGLVAIHDGARPVVPQEDIEATIRTAGECGAACLVAEVTDTMKRVEDRKIVETVDRSSLRKALTPQCFRFEVIMSAFENADPSIEFTDDCSIVERSGQRVEFVEGSDLNIKITYPHDLAMAEIYLKRLFEKEGNPFKNAR
jgi:2-C-methyl-D-erythritol 4-phosphate cytidylyltransferase